MNRLTDWWQAFWARRAEAEHPPIRRRIWQGPTRHGQITITDTVYGDVLDPGEIGRRANESVEKRQDDDDD